MTHPIATSGRLKIPAILSMIALLFPGGLDSAFADERAMLIPRTAQTNDVANTTLAQSGGMFFLGSLWSYEARTFSIGMWVRRYTDVVNAGSNSLDEGTLFMADRSIDGMQFRVPTSHLPADTEWHYVRVDMSALEGGYSLTEAYVDNALVLSQTNNGTFFSGVTIGAYHGGWKGPTRTSLVVDDVMIWHEPSEAISEIHTEIYKSGMDAFNSADPNLKAYYDFNDTPPAYFYWEDTGNFLYADETVQDNQRYYVSVAAYNLIDATAKPVNFVKVTIDSDYGLAKITPSPGSTGVAEVLTGSRTTFRAPLYIYLDRYGNELDGTAEDIRDKAYYRMVNDGYSAAGDAFQGTPTTSFTLTVSSAMTVTWFWRKEYAVIIESSTANLDGVSKEDFSALGNPSLAVQKHWFSEDVLFTAAIDGMVNESNAPVRFASTGYVLDNMPDSTDRCLVFGGANDVLVLDGQLPPTELRSFTIEFWARRDSRATTEDEDVVVIGDGSEAGRLLRAGFRSSAEGNAMFLSDNSSGVIASVDSALTDDQWHHWAWSYDNTSSTLALYRDGEALESFSQALSFSTPSGHRESVYIGGLPGGSNSYAGSVNNVRVWTTALTQAEIEQCMITDQYESGTAGLLLELAFDDPDVESITSSEGYAGTLVNFGDLFPETATAAQKEAALFPKFYWNQPENVLGRIQTSQFSIQDWARVTWRWDREYRLRVRASEQGYEGLPFVTTESGTVEGSVTEEIWVPEFRAVTVGTQYRTDDRRYTLSKIVGQSGSLRAITMNTVEDGSLNGAVTRQYTIPRLSGYGDLVFTYERTIFRAEIPIGQGLDLSSTEGLNAALVPDLCDGAELDLDGTGPADMSSNPILPSLASGGTAAQSGRRILFDKVGQQLLPLLPGTFMVEWQDANDPGSSYLIEVSTHLPAETLDLYYHRENDDGSRQGSHPDYVTEVTFDGVTSEFPASPQAHYRHFYGALNETPPVDLDVNEADRWHFDELTYSTGRVAVDSQTMELSASSPAMTVLLFSYAPYVTDAAKGDSTREAYLTRVVEARAVADATRPFDTVSASNRKVVEFDGASAHVVEVTSSADGEAVELIAGASRTIEFWHKRSSTSSTSEKIVWEQSGAAYDAAVQAQLQAGFRGSSHSSNPDGFFFELSSTPTGLWTDFSTGVPDGTQVNGTAEVSDGILILTHAAMDEGGSFIIDDLNNGEVVTDFKVKFKVRMGDGSATPADGFSFSFGEAINDGIYTEEGIGSPLRIRFDAFDNGGSDTAPSIEVAYASVNLSVTSMSGYRLGDREPATAILTDAAGNELSLNTGPEWVEVTISMDADGTLDLTWDGTPVVTDLATSFAGGSGWQMALSARTGTSYQTHYFDDLVVSLNADGIPAGEVTSLVNHDFPELSLDDNWHHWAVTATSDALLSFYLDGRLIGSRTASLTFGKDVFTRTIIGGSILESFGALGQMDNFRVWSRALSAAELRESMLRAIPSDTSGLEINATFDDNPAEAAFAHSGSNSATLSNASPREMLVYSADAPVEVATRIDSKLDTADLDSGYIINEISNYNPGIHDRSAEAGAWGGIYPVNWSGLFTGTKALEIAWYENPSLALPDSSSILHPNVSWPYVVVSYDTVEFPQVGEHKDKRIYVASRLGTEGVDAAGTSQTAFDPELYSELAVYNQPDPYTAGYNPNEEHALVAPSIKDLLTGDTAFNLGQDAAFALQNGLNNSNTSDVTQFTSEPWVLVQYRRADTDEIEMAAYKVEIKRSGSASFPALDPATHLPTDSLGQPVAQPDDPTYDFYYPAFAGDPLIPLYPLNLVIGNVVLSENWGGQIGAQRTLWKDINENHWFVSGEGECFFSYWYPFRDDFWYDLDRDGDNDLNVSTPIAFVPSNGAFLESGASTPSPAIVRYHTYWRDSYPVLKLGESLSYAGGENKAENASAEGLPALVGFKSAQIVYDSYWPVMRFDETDLTSGNLYSARVIRPLERIEYAIAQSDMPDALTPAYTDNIMVVAERWHFKALTGSLQKRVYYDSLTSQLVFRGKLNDLESGDPDLTATPASTYVLEPNIMTFAEYEALLGLSSDPAWSTAVASLFTTSQDPNGTGLPAGTTEQKFYAGMELAENAAVEQPGHYLYTSSSDTVSDYAGATSHPNDYQHLNSFGSGSVLVPNPDFIAAGGGSTAANYVTIAENNHPDAGGAVSLHIVTVGPERYRGSIKVLEAQNALDEKINLKHSGDFGGNIESVYYQWWVRDVASLASAGLPGEDVAWQVYRQGLGLNCIDFRGRPDIVLSDKLFYVRYGLGSELSLVTIDGTLVSNTITGDPDTASVDDESWRLVAFSGDSWDLELHDPVPFQWAGAANSPQLQADGSKVYIPQLVMGWVKRVLDRINPYEARYSDFYSNESPATYSSMLQIAGKPYVGQVALNADKDVVENAGLVELYETVLNRAKELSLEVAGGSTSGTDQAILLAATRLAFLYELLAREAYHDAQSPLIRVTEENGLDLAASYVHAFYNQQATLLDEELGLLRGTDFLKAYPAYNRLFWNYVKGEGEAAYNASYNIYDVTQDGFINEDDAAALFPQGHGDAWGHFLSAQSMHYELLKHTAFDWESTSELYSLLDNVIEADYLDEKSFARIAAAKARTGLEIVNATYRKAYTEDPSGQWQGYTDPDSARAWGVSEWAKRSGQGALFDWMAGNALVAPASADPLDDLGRIDRIANRAELSEVAASLVSIQAALDQSNNGLNPVGLDHETVVFDLDPLLYDGSGGIRKAHFEQAYEKAVGAAQNALAALEQASRADHQVQRIATDTLALQTEALRQDIDYRNRLIEIFGTPYTGTIGTGKAFEEGYSGPDTLLYLYIDRVETDGLIPSSDARYLTLKTSAYSKWATDYTKLDWNPNFATIKDGVADVFSRYYLTADFPGVDLGEAGDSSARVLSIEAPVLETADYAFQADAAWGTRTGVGKIQMLLNEMLHEQIVLQQTIRDYAEYIEGLELLTARMVQELRVHEKKEQVRSKTAKVLTGLYSAMILAAIAEGWFSWSWDLAWQSAVGLTEFFPRVVGFSNDPSSVARGAVRVSGIAMTQTFKWGWTAALVARYGTEIAAKVVEAQAAGDELILQEFREMNAMVSELGVRLTQEEGKRIAIGQHVQRMQMLAGQFQSARAEGFRLLEEREAFNMVLAAKAQRNRYRDMVLRLARNESVTQYQSAFENALRYAWLSAKAYDYETSLDAGDPAAATSLLEDLVKCRTLGLWQNGLPRPGQGGIAHHLARMKANFDTLKGQLGINNPQIETDRLSLRHEHFRIGRNSPASDERWRQAMQAARVEDLWSVPEYVQFCRPFSSPAQGSQPGIVLEFNTEIEPGKNIFGRLLGGADHSYSSANYATKIRSLGIWFENYNSTGLSTSPRVYLVPAGSDVLRIANGRYPVTRTWNVVEQRIPVPFVINQSDLDSPDFIPSLHSLNGSFADIRRFGDFRAYHTSGGASIDNSQLMRSSRLIGRSVWNTRWLLIIPAATLHSDTEFGLEQFVKNVSDIKLVFETYSHEGN